MTRQKRRALNKTERLASALLQIKRGSEWLIPEPLRSTGTAEEIAAHAIEWDHRIPLASGGGNEPQNMQPLSKAAHLAKTKRDVANIARAKRLAKKQEDFRRALLTKETGDLTREKFSKRKSKLEYTRWKHMYRRKMDGTVVPR